MAKKLSDIEQLIKEKEKDFIPYLKELLDKEVFSFLIDLSKLDSLYLFSGIIRNYFLGVKEVRDVDIMIDSSKDISGFVSKFKHRKNSYGGYKIFINDTTVDLWYLQDTWALHNSQKVIEFELEKYIPNTAFFNFSSILYSFEENSFIYTKYFLRFLRDKKIDYVFEPNANYALCVVNSFYYQDKLKLDFTDKLKEYLQKLNKKYSSDYENVQLKHFGEIIYSKTEIQKEIAEM
ncbi:hypothetical protein GCM10027036_34840 [Flavihumibacter cheonanensis]|uniref:hypothetical protein n=1 Tax=Flavihumibacter cheonanensis TaxID=1442385 RepID=UPI001EF822CB|nr:hypothetical protein [Flavihumibacter cheonanensis]MCG7753488.1 hypothetical protein [Flavihumibacter cheonanensis]